jgi:diaminopimelate decarboxylase
MHYFTYKNDKLYCEDMPVDKLAEEFGTPLYVYSRRTLIEHFDKIRDAFAAVSPVICYSVKANSNLSILKTLVDRGSGLDIVSGGELFRAVSAGCPAQRIVYASVGKTETEITEAINKGILLFNVESLPELDRIDAIAGKLGKRQSVALRVNPDVDAMTHEYITTARKKAKFGLDLATARDVLVNGRKRYTNLSLDGVHIHIGSQITSAEPFIEALKKMSDFIADVRRNGAIIEYFDIGGGLGIIYNDEQPQTAAEFALKVLPMLQNLDVKIILEPGRFIVGNAGILLAQVQYVKESYEKRFVIVDAAMNDLIRPSLYSAFHRIEPVRRRGTRNEGRGKKVDVVGPVCESGDFLGKDRELDVDAGEYLAVMSAGAYGFAMSSNYNSRRRAAEVMVDGGKYRLIRERERYEDLISREKML